MRKIGNWILKELLLEIELKPAIGVYHVKMGWIWIIYFGVKLLAGVLHLITDLIKWL
jgi:hypothetical protein